MTAHESQIFRDLMQFKPAALTPNAWAVKAGVSRTVWADMRRHGNPSRRTLEKLLAAAETSLAEFEALRLGPDPRQDLGKPGGLGDAARSWRGAVLPPLPLIGSRPGGAWDGADGEVEITEILPGDILERLPRPPSLAHDAAAFAVTIIGDSMSPRFDRGSRVAVSPRSPVAPGDDVLVRLRLEARPGETASARTLIKRLVDRNEARVELRQFNPDRCFSVDTQDLDAILRIPGELI